MSTQRVRFLRGTGLGGIGNDANPGDERDLPIRQATEFIAGGRAVAVAAAAPIEAPAPQAEETHKPARKKVK